MRAVISQERDVLGTQVRHVHALAARADEAQPGEGIDRALPALLAHHLPARFPEALQQRLERIGGDEMQADAAGERE